MDIVDVVDGVDAMNSGRQERGPKPEDKPFCDSSGESGAVWRKFGNAQCSAGMGLSVSFGWITTSSLKFMGKELKKLNPTSCTLRRSIRATGASISGACDRQKQIAGFDQEKFSKSHVLCIGAGGLISNVAPALVRKGIGALSILDDDDVEVSNLNRQRFYFGDIGQNKAMHWCATSTRMHLRYKVLGPRHFP
jgi:hypothetical protein